MAGFRPAFYPKDPILRAIELLAWAVRQPCFTMAEIRDAFREQLLSYKDPDHEISERLRKLRQSGMIVVADKGMLDTQQSILDAKVMNQANLSGQPKDPPNSLTTKRLSFIRGILAEMQDPRKRRSAGRPLRLYFATQAAAKYVTSRQKDLS